MDENFNRINYFKEFKWCLIMKKNTIILGLVFLLIILICTPNITSAKPAERKDWYEFKDEDEDVELVIITYFTCDTLKETDRSNLLIEAKIKFKSTNIVNITIAAPYSIIEHPTRNETRYESVFYADPEDSVIISRLFEEVCLLYSPKEQEANIMGSVWCRQGTYESKINFSYELFVIINYDDDTTASHTISNQAPLTLEVFGGGGGFAGVADEVWTSLLITFALTLGLSIAIFIINKKRSKRKRGLKRKGGME